MEWIVLGALGCMNNADFEKKLVNEIAYRVHFSTLECMWHPLG